MFVYMYICLNVQIYYEGQLAWREILNRLSLETSEVNRGAYGMQLGTPGEHLEGILEASVRHLGGIRKVSVRNLGLWGATLKTKVMKNIILFKKVAQATVSRAQERPDLYDLRSLRTKVAGRLASATSRHLSAFLTKPPEPPTEASV